MNICISKSKQNQNDTLFSYLWIMITLQNGKKQVLFVLKLFNMNDTEAWNYLPYDKHLSLLEEVGYYNKKNPNCFWIWTLDLPGNAFFALIMISWELQAFITHFNHFKFMQVGVSNIKTTNTKWILYSKCKQPFEKLQYWT